MEINASPLDSEAAIAAFAALAQANRLAIFRLLVQAGRNGLPAGDIAQALDVAPSSLSFHLSHLARAGLVTQERQSRHIIYRAAFERMQELIAYMLENCCAGEGCDAESGVFEGDCR